MQMRAIEKEMADGAYRISHILWDFPFGWKQTHTHALTHVDVTISLNQIGPVQASRVAAFA